MAQATTQAETSEVQTGSNEWFGLGLIGWVIWAGMFLMNFVGGMSVFSGAVALAGYFLFCTVGSYLWIRFLKFILIKIGFFN